MKISKQKLKKIIVEELTSLSESDDKVSKKISYLMDKEGKPQKQAVAMALDMEERGKLEESVPMDLIGQFIGFIQKNPEVAVAAISSNAAALGIAEMLESLADKVREGLANRESDMMKETEHEGEKEDDGEDDDEDALVLKGPKVDPLGDSLAARRLRAIARRKAGDKR